MAIYLPGQQHRLIKTGPFTVRVSSNMQDFFDVAGAFYPLSPYTKNTGQFVDFHIRLLKLLPLRRCQIKRIQFVSDTRNPFPTFPVEHHFALFEWGMNWCIAILAHQYLLLHSAVLEKNGKALILPAFPGSGKSTLCASLVLRGWRLLSDEFGLYHPEKRTMTPIPRPIALKNQSIRVISEFDTAARLGPIFRGTHKGNIAHVHVPRDSIERADETAVPRWIVFPQYKEKTQTVLHKYHTGPAFLKLAGNAFNYKLQGLRGFHAVKYLVRHCDTHYLEFDSLEHAHEQIERLTA